MNTKQFRYVLVLAHEGSFSRAADVLGISQPSLSQYIKKIEREIGAELFDRTSSDVRLTDAGRVYIDAGRKILDLEHRMEVAFSDLESHKTGSLIIGTSPYRAASMMPRISAAFRQLHPGMHLIVREGTTAELAEGMEHGEYDLSLTLRPDDGRLFEWEKVMEEEIILGVPAVTTPLAAERVPGRKYPAVDASVLNDRSLVMLTDTQYMQKQLRIMLEDHEISVFTAAVVKSLEAQIAMVRAGVGAALLPTGIERFCSPGEVTFYSFLEPLPKREVVVVWRKDRALPSVALELKDVIHSIPW